MPIKFPSGRAFQLQMQPIFKGLNFLLSKHSAAANRAHSTDTMQISVLEMEPSQSVGLPPTAKVSAARLRPAGASQSLQKQDFSNIFYQQKVVCPYEVDKHLTSKPSYMEFMEHRMAYSRSRKSWSQESFYPAQHFSNIFSTTIFSFFPIHLTSINISGSHR